MDRIPAIGLTPSTNGHGKRSRKAKEAPSTPSNAARQRQAAAQLAVKWAHRYTALAIVLSAGLNAYASRTGEGIAHQLAGATLGASVPVAVWVLAQVAAWTYRAGWRRLAYVPSIVATAMLALSVTHCATAFASLTGTGLALSVCLAIGIDCGLVASEATGILVSTVD
jgi:hypothetical protein